MNAGDDLDPMDILAFTTDELRNCFTIAINASEQDSAIVEYLKCWESDCALKKLKKLNVQFEKDLNWFNVSQPLTTDSFHGKLVILDFFTYCCINCMHVFPDLKALEQRFSVEEGLVVVGVHSPKFENEKYAVNILSAIKRYNITHPIVNDPHSLLWNALHIKCWPTLLVLSPRGEPLLLLMGEGHRVFLEKFIHHALQYFAHKGQIHNFEIPLLVSTDVMPASNLKFPAKIACLKKTRGEKDGAQLFAIADTGNNRILIIDDQGVVLYRIGGCNAGFEDGNFETAQFNAPQGVAFVTTDVLVVADTENHAIRQISLKRMHVTTVVGNGKQGTDKIGGKVGTLQEICSPWDVVAFKSRDMDMSFHIDEQNVPEKTVILIAMAGTHQIWGYFPEGVIWWKFKKLEPLTCLSLIGNGMEENRNNSYPQNAAFAQPSGLALADEFLFIADSESSSVRKASIVDGKVMAVVGGDRNPLNLFAFGDADGKQYNAKLQHPLGLTHNHSNDKIYVADTYNHKIKVIDIETNTIETCDVRDAAKPQNLYQFNEPGGLCCDVSGQKLFVADTNNHRIQIVHLETMLSHCLNLDFSKVLRSHSETNECSAAGIKLRRYVPMYGCKNLQLNISVALKDDFKFTPGAHQTWNCTSSNFMVHKDNKISGTLYDGMCTLQLQRVESEVDSSATEEVQLDFILNLCDMNSCVVRRFSLILTNPDGKNICAENVNEELNLNITKTDIEIR